MDDVRKHNGVGGANTWIVIKNVVYDVTNYMDDVSNFVFEFL